jgi:RNA polymerase sigma-70 factor (ECF subfamily)
VPPEPSTGELVLRVRAGDRAAGEALVRRHLRPAYAVALAVLRNPAEAEDVAQESLVHAFERLDDCREPDRFAGWLVRIVRNRSLDAALRIRARGKAVDVAEAAAVGVAGDAERSALRARLLAAMERLPPVPREVVLLHDLEGWTHAEIGAALEISEVNSRQHLFVARRTLRAWLEGASPEEASHGS